MTNFLESGFDPSDLPNIFEPFFTTKQTVGTGLGLWVSKTIVQKLDCPPTWRPVDSATQDVFGFE